MITSFQRYARLLEDGLCLEHNDPSMSEKIKKPQRD